jgi:hypothetical protein
LSSLYTTISIITKGGEPKEEIGDTLVAVLEALVVVLVVVIQVGFRGFGCTSGTAQH